MTTALATLRERSRRQAGLGEAQVALAQLEGVQNAFGSLSGHKRREVMSFPVVAVLKDCLDSLVRKMKSEASGVPSEPHHHGEGTPDYSSTVDRVDALAKALKWPATRLRALVLSRDPLNIVDFVKNADDAEAAKRAAKRKPATA